MKSGNKIFSYFFLILFLVSNTGLPLSLHFCKMMKEVSTNSCDMCSTRQHHENSGSGISSHHPVCCEVKAAAVPIEDNYLAVKSDLNNYAVDFVLPEPVISEMLISTSEAKIQTDTSPPLSEDQEIFILNSSFLI